MSSFKVRVISFLIELILCATASGLDYDLGRYDPVYTAPAMSDMDYSTATEVGLITGQDIVVAVGELGPYLDDARRRADELGCLFCVASDTDGFFSSGLWRLRNTGKWFTIDPDPVSLFKHVPAESRVELIREVELFPGMIELRSRRGLFGKLNCGPLG